MEIGGYMELEHFGGRPYHTNVYELNLGRTALIWYLRHVGCRTLFVPYFLCNSVTEACIAADISLEYYRIDENLAPRPARMPGEDEYLYLVNYYGQLTDEQILAFQVHYGRIIVDHTHAFFQKPLRGVPTIYSCRKFLGVPDGAYLSCSEELPLPDETDASRNRMRHLLGRFECPASDYYADMLATAETFHAEPPKCMSPLTKNLLNAIDYTAVRKRRHRNYLFLKEYFDQEHILSHNTPMAPFAYPLRVPDGIAVRKELARRKIYIPTYWNNVIASMPEHSTEYEFAANILALPCDQRYGLWEMEHLANAVQSAVRQLGE